MPRRKKMPNEVKMHELANIVRDFTRIPHRKIPLLISFEKLKKSDISALKDAKVDVCEVMPELNMVYIEIVPRKKILDNLRKIKNIKRVSISREVEVHDS